MSEEQSTPSTSNVQAPTSLMSYDRPGYRYYALGLLTVVGVVNFVDRQMLAILLPAIKEDMQLSDTELGFVSGIAFGLVYSIMGIPLARWADKGNRRSLLSMAIAVWSLMTALCGASLNIVHLALARAGVGIGEAGATPPSHSIISDIFSEKFRATALSIYALSIPVGILVGYWFGGWLVEHMNWRIAFFVVGIPGILVAIIVRFTLKEPTRSSAYKDAQKAGQITVKETIKWMFSYTSYRHLVIAGSLMTFSAYAFMSWVPSFLTRSYEVSISFAGFGLAIVLGFGGAIGTFLGGFLSDRLATKFNDKRWYMMVPGIAGVLYASTAWMFYFAPNVNVSLVLMFIPIVLLLSYSGPMHAVSQTLAGPTRRAMASGVLILIMNLVGLAFGPQFIGLVSDILKPQFGEDSLKYAMAIVISAATAWAGFHYIISSKYLQNDLKRAEELNR